MVRRLCSDFCQRYYASLMKVISSNLCNAMRSRFTTSHRLGKRVFWGKLIGGLCVVAGILFPLAVGPMGGTFSIVTALRYSARSFSSLVILSFSCWPYCIGVGTVAAAIADYVSCGTWAKRNAWWFELVGLMLLPVGTFVTTAIVGETRSISEVLLSLLAADQEHDATPQWDETKRSVEWWHRIGSS
jgi:hypothetical protein